MPTPQSYVFHFISFVKRGLMSKVISGKYGEVAVTSEWGYYQSWSEYSKTLTSFFAEPASGAYIFRPDTPEAEFHKLKPIPSKVHVYESSITTEIHSTFEGSWIYQVTKLYKDSDYIDIEYSVGPIPVDDGVGKEVVHRIRTNITNSGIFYTDSNGREFLRRQRSQRQTWKLREFEPIAGNYYPVNTAMYIEDDFVSASVLTDRSQGGSSLVDGSLELMVHRRMIRDDSRGVGEALNETASISPYPPYGDASRLGEGLIITGKHRLYIGYKKSGAKMARQGMDQLFSPLHVFAGKISDSFTGLKDMKEQLHLSGMPSNIQILTLKLKRSDGKNKHILLRLGHAYGKDECTTNSVPTDFNLVDMFPNYEVISVKEKTLTGNQSKENWMHTRSMWKSSQEDKDYSKNVNTIRLNLMEIKTFSIMLKKMNELKKSESN